MNDLDLICQIKALVLLDSNGKRIHSAFYDQNIEEFKTEKDRRAFESKVHEKNKITNSELEIIDQFIVVGGKTGELELFIVGYKNVNELVLLDVFNVLTSLMRRICATEDSSVITKKGILDNYWVLRLYLDEIISDGIVFEVDEETIVARTPLADQGATDLNNAIEMAKERFSYFTKGR
ncbi:hypothetical protein PPL_03051 [Heterostelium album PN500]|uniref:AP complex mu/sigma subunit domain-containing protein n=1 Tax=Heterostelium pallidum (strain ATCC 26659 / Pp 5 / PN500) TaxID=670386 RepID=D3B3T0_HETP5|nr:hypothetical protein PPL_03051 [Heterostelium album PN500]EFA83978.1 hypothetical protein PPL_03051 [Heterostelium album PN500]|eukprot:XP_020436095.1 hypothetical protein PPL_03051 [Heterostelium album PN500]